MDRIYLNRAPGQRRVHIEIAENEVLDLLDDFTPADGAFDATKRLRVLLELAAKDFDEANRDDAYEADISRT
ncbi:hypothetical protein ACWGNN_00760 [Streptomyces sp. NPDC055817]